MLPGEVGSGDIYVHISFLPGGEDDPAALASLVIPAAIKVLGSIGKYFITIVLCLSFSFCLLFYLLFSIGVKFIFTFEFFMIRHLNVLLLSWTSYSERSFLILFNFSLYFSHLHRSL